MERGATKNAGTPAHYNYCTGRADNQPTVVVRPGAAFIADCKNSPTQLMSVNQTAVPLEFSGGMQQTSVRKIRTALLQLLLLHAQAAMLL